MEITKKHKTITAAMISTLLILLLILSLTLKHSKTFNILVGIDSAAILTILIWYLLHHFVHKPTTQISLEDGEELRLEYSALRKAAGLPAKFRYATIEAATDGFQSLIGRGSSGSVFKGILDDGTVVAVKRIEDGEYADREFRAEVAAVGSVQHVSLVRLLGYCLVPGGGARFLVYEFFPNGSLDKWIFPASGGDRERPALRRSKRGCLPWSLRYRAAIDIARALSYLHHDCRSKVLHLDVKPENILLDESFSAYLSDFGLSKLLRRDESRVVPSLVRGTRGYMAPEWILANEVSEKCDVYGYGMVVLEMVAGRRSAVRVVTERKWSLLPKIMTDKVKERRVMDVVDERLNGVDETEVVRLVSVALWCIQERPQLRPSMARVVDILEGRTTVEAPPPETAMPMMDFLCVGEEWPVGCDGGPSAADYSFAVSMSTLSGR